MMNRGKLILPKAGGEPEFNESKVPTPLLNEGKQTTHEPAGADTDVRSNNKSHNETVGLTSDAPAAEKKEVAFPSRIVSQTAEHRVGTNTLLGISLPSAELPDFVSESRWDPPAEPAEAPDPTPGVIQGRYELFENLATGGMGRVFRGFDRQLNRNIAVKILRSRFLSNDDVATRFTQEALITSRLQHPGIVPVYETGKLKDGRPFIAMKLVEGCTLRQLLESRDNLKNELVHFLTIFEQVCQTVAYAHSKGVIHRDIKTDNIMVGAFGEVQVMDWGLAKSMDTTEDKISARAITSEADICFSPQDNGLEESESTKVQKIQIHSNYTRKSHSTSAGLIIGTYQYMPPEQARGDNHLVDRASDVFALGAVLCEIITGSPPYSMIKNVAKRQAQLADLREATEKLTRSEVDSQLIRIVLGCLKEAKENRFPDAEILARELGIYFNTLQDKRKDELVNQVKASLPAPRNRQFLSTIFGNQWKALLSFCLLAGVCLGLGWLLSSKRSSMRFINQQNLHTQEKERELALKFWHDQIDSLAQQSRKTRTIPRLWSLKETLSKEWDRIQPTWLMDEKLVDFAQTAECLHNLWKAKEKNSFVYLSATSDNLSLTFFDQQLSLWTGNKATTRQELAQLVLEKAKASPWHADLQPFLYDWISRFSETDSKRELLGRLDYTPKVKQALTELVCLDPVSELKKHEEYANILENLEFSGDELVVLTGYFRSRKLLGLAERFAKLILVDPADPFFAHRELANTYAQVDGYAFEAQKHALAACACHPESSITNLELAVIYERTGRLDDAITQLKKLQKSYFHPLEVNWYLATSYKAKGNDWEALLQYEKILQSGSTIPAEVWSQACFQFVSLVGSQSRNSQLSKEQFLHATEGLTVYLRQLLELAQRNTTTSILPVLSQLLTDSRCQSLKSKDFLSQLDNDKSRLLLNVLNDIQVWVQSNR